MACKKTASTELTEEQKKILSALAMQENPVASKEIAAETGIESKSMGCKIRGLKDKGYIESPVRCKYVITGEGRSQLGSK